MTLDETQTLDDFLQSIERRAYRMAVIATGNRDDALDIVQDAMCKLVKRYRDRGPKEWGPLFHTILQSTIRDWYRRYKVRNQLLQWLPSAERESGYENKYGQEFAGRQSDRPEQKHQYDIALSKLDTAFHQLPLRQQQVFLLRQWEGFGVAETAKVMRCSEGSVKTHYSRAVHSLRAKLEGYWP